MAEDIPDDRFKSEVIRLLQTAITKVDGLEKKVDVSASDIKSIRLEVKMLSGQFNDVGVMII